MAGCRALTEQEIYMVYDALKNKRDRLLFVLGVRTGFRISEILALRVKDVYRDGRALDRVKVLKRFLKEKKGSRELPIHSHAQVLIEAYARDLTTDHLFPSRMGGTISRFTAHKILKDAFAKAGLKGNLATHSMRKSFAKKVYRSLGYDLVSLRDALGHSHVGTTMDYIQANEDAINRAVLE